MASPNTIILSVVGIFVACLLLVGLTDSADNARFFIGIGIALSLSALIGSLVGYVVGHRRGNDDLAVPTIVGALAGCIGIPAAIGLIAWAAYSIFG